MRGAANRKADITDDVIVLTLTSQRSQMQKSDGPFEMSQIKSNKLEMQLNNSLDVCVEITKNDIMRL